MFAAEIRRKRAQQLRAFSKGKWHVDEVFVKVNGKRYYLWWAVDHEGEVLGAVVAKRWNKAAAENQKTSRWQNHCVENSHLPFRRRERAMQRLRRMRSLQKFASVRSSVCNHFNQERSLASRDIPKPTRSAALAEWRELGAG